MKSLYLLMTLFVLLFSSLKAGEVDPFFAIDEEIGDSKEILNSYLNKAVTDILVQYNEKNAVEESCENVSLHIMQELGTDNYFVTKRGALNSDFELWVNANENIDRSPKYGSSQEEYVQKSIYAPKLKFFGVWPKKLDATINIGGVYVGIDKLSHFLGSGYEYFNIYLQAKEEGLSEGMAQLKAIEWGLKMENSILGRWSVGVFSYADLEANYQGFLFAKDLCENSILSVMSGKYKLNEAIKIEKYVTPNWDELYNPNAYTSKREENIHENMHRLGICENTNRQKYSQRFLYYKSLLQPTFLSSLLSVCTTEHEPDAKGQYEKLVQTTPLDYTYTEFKERFIVLCQKNKAVHLELCCSVHK